MILLLLFFSWHSCNVAGNGEDFIKRVEEIIENENNTLEQKQKLVELETVFAYGEKFRFQDKMVDLNQFYSRGRGEEEIVETTKLSEEDLYVKEVNEEESESPTILMMSHVITYIDTMKYTLTHPSSLKYPPAMTLIVCGSVLCLAGLCGGIGLWYCRRAHTCSGNRDFVQVSVNHEKVQITKGRLQNKPHFGEMPGGVLGS